jgi:RNA polymerase sigma factor (sigma-70 family)
MFLKLSVRRRGDDLCHYSQEGIVLMKPNSIGNDVVTNETPTEMSDELLVSAAKSGDANAFVELSRRHSAKLLHRTYRITRSERKQLLEEAILGLPVLIREVVQLRRTQECSVRELAEALGISVPAAKSRLSRAKTALRMSLCGND